MDTDVLCVDTATLKRLCVLSFIEIGTRRVHLAGITNPTWVCTTQGTDTNVFDELWSERLTSVYAKS